MTDAPVPTPHRATSRTTTRTPARLRASVAGVLVAAALLLAPAGAGAVVGPAAADPTALSWGVVPAENDQGAGRANFAYDVRPGQEVRDAVVVTNHGQTALDLDVYAADARTTTSGQLDLLPADEPSTGVGTWVQLDLPAVSLAPGASVEVPFTVRVPADATPGDHSGGVVTAAVSADDGSTVRLDRRLALRMHLRVDGAVAPAVAVEGLAVEHRGTANPLAAGTVVVRYRVTNTGNARVLPTEAVTVAGLAGTRRTVPSAAADAEPLEVLPGSSLEREVVLDGVRSLGPVDVQVQAVATAVGLGGGATARAAAEASVVAVPWALVALLVLVVAAGVALLLRRRRTRAGVSPVAPGSPESGTSGAGGRVLPDSPRPHDGGQPA
ncbi:WxL protein peptidoglycan domain-containing protein [Cellulomonas endometrii]|uniref:WxL protein peptidoglycan domain-containing protein n=1 Tax=Cellulomonas endometrii TaxID=3036301 RepID=UPI0024AE0672|nr:DUF916 domain-containing protein [Cellulomonas endometrii]